MESTLNLCAIYGYNHNKNSHLMATLMLILFNLHDVALAALLNHGLMMYGLYIDEWPLPYQTKYLNIAIKYQNITAFFTR